MNDLSEQKLETIPPGRSERTKDLNVGGQAVIEGVMMRSPTAIATAVRLPDGTIELKKQPFVSFVHRHRAFNIPILRGAINFFEMLIIGLDTLNWSADIQMQYEDRQNGRDTKKHSAFINSLLLWGTVVFAVTLSILLFFSLPIWIATLLGLTRGAFLFNLVAGTIRLLLFLAYIIVISRMPDVRRVFKYHGAEHMSIFDLEVSGTLEVESVRRRSRFHPRCGTSFILIVALFAIFFFGIADSLFPMLFGHIQSFGERLATHLLLLPAVAGISYELLKLSGKHRSRRLVRALIMPGLWLQKLTTQPPDDDMLEVALCALNAAIDGEGTRS
ncbi:DUF1385 domain-containing protein [Candidatus Latescibacterota bacterium]